MKVEFLSRKVVATLIAVVTAGALALANYLAKTKKPVVFTILPMFSCSL